jgi:YVTN family beta-propeller protein
VNVTQSYGLGIDSNGYIWNSQWTYNHISKISAGGSVEAGFPKLSGGSGSRGVAVTADDNVWVANSISNTVSRLDNTGTILKTIPVGLHPTGVAVDAKGKVWVTNLNSDNAMRIDPNADGDGLGAVDMTVNLGSGAGPYNYSDMTGTVATGSTSPQGIWTVVHNGGSAGIDWGFITWNTEPEGSEPVGTSITVKARAANSQAGLSGETFIAVTNGGAFSLAGQFIEVQATLRPNLSDISPILSELSVERSDDEPPIASNLLADPNPAEINTSIAITAKIDDSTTGNSNIISAAYTVDGVAPVGMAAVDAAFDSPTEDVTASRTFTAAGVHTICVTGDDAVPLTSNEICVLLAVYDPSAGFVTGGGWIDSPAGAYVLDPVLFGKATFGFVSKYKKGQSTPDGNTQFQFHAAGMKFKSVSYDWLVIAGKRAQYKGVGTINGAGNYGFMLFGIDGDLPGGDGIDKFRIKIWDEDNSDAVVYDNEIGVPDDADATTEISRGSIVIHKK